MSFIHSVLILNCQYSIYRYVWKALPSVEWLPGEHQNCLWKLERWQWLHWCDPSLWGWSAGGGTQGDLGCFQSFLSEVTWKEQTPSPADLHEGGEIWWSIVNCGLSLSRRSKCFPRESGLLPGYRWRTSAEGFHGKVWWKKLNIL